MRAWFLVLLLAAGCHKKDRFDAILADLEVYTTRMCACADAACAERVSTELRGYRDTLASRVGNAKASDEQEERGRKLDYDLRECRKKLVPQPAP